MVHTHRDSVIARKKREEGREREKRIVCSMHIIHNIFLCSANFLSYGLPFRRYLYFAITESFDIMFVCMCMIIQAQGNDS